MHRALRIPEIVGLVCDHLEYIYLTQDGPNDFATLARTCKSFHDPALDVLWRRQNTLANVLKSLPSDVWEERHDVKPPQPPAVRFIKTPQLADWTRPLTYAHRIRKLTLMPARRRAVHDFPTSDVLAMIELCFPGGYLCPNLQDLFWSPEGNTPAFHYIRLFLGPHITHASIQLPANVADMSPLSSLRYPELKSLSLKGSSDDTSLIRRTLCTFASELAKIERLSLDSLDQTVLLHLSRLPRLRSLDLSKTDLDPQDFVSLVDISQDPFPALRKLSLDDTTVESATELVNMMHDCRLDDFFMCTDIFSLQAATGKLYAALAGHVSHITLHSMWMIEMRDELVPPPVDAIASYVITGHTLTPLFSFKNLALVHLTGPVGFDIDDTRAWDMARAWPQIRSLTLNSSTALHHPSSMTLHGLRAFATHCAELRRLAIAFDASTVPPFDNSPAARISQRALHALHVEASPIGDPPSVAKYLSGLFLGLVSIYTWNDARWSEPAETDEDEETAAARARHTQWKYVEVLVPFIASVREEERQWVDGK
ncbi:hypothetical protein DFH06DRAFT_1114027 [Mycena polygramma]|nr:hypothetical protein DFH06DRAFT_1114027 [Mycena polygramma]